MRLIHIQFNTGISNKLKHFKAANFQRQLRKILHLFSLMLPTHVTYVLPTCLTFSLNKKFKATLTYDIHWISVFTNQGVNHGKHQHQPFQKLAQLFVGLQLKIF